MAGKAKGSLSNQLLGKTIVPKPEFGDPANQDTFGPANARIWSGLKPNASGEWIAIVDAAWIEDGVVKMAVHDPHGNTAMMWFSNVNLGGSLWIVAVLFSLVFLFVALAARVVGRASAQADAALEVAIHTATCKFCGYSGADFRDCENGSDPETHEPYYCGNLECPACCGCQGNEATAERIKAGRFSRAVKEGRWNRGLETATRS